MRAAVLHDYFGSPRMEDLPEPVAGPGALKIRVATAGLQPTDIWRSERKYKIQDLPYVVGGEGVGHLADGTRVYFGHSVGSHGALSQWTIVPEQEVWPIGDDIDDGQAIALAIAGTGALIPLEVAKIQPGETVLILGATGPVGQVGLLAARAIGAGKVVAAARSRNALERLKARGAADEIVVMGQGADADLDALKAASGGGFDVVLDTVFGAPAALALKATRVGARFITIGLMAGDSWQVEARDMTMRWHSCVGTGWRPAAERRAAYDRLLAYAREHAWHIDIAPFGLEDAPDAWEAQRGSPGAKIVVRVGP